MALIGRQAETIQPKRETAPHTTANPAPNAAANPAPQAEAAPKPVSKPGRKPGQKAKTYDLDKLSMDVLNAPQAVDETLAARVAPQRARDEKQVAIDNVVKRVHSDWLRASKPGKWAQMPKVRYNLHPSTVEGFKYLVRRAADYHGVAIKWGTSVRDQHGNEVVVFAVRDRRPRESSDATGSDD